MNLLYNSARITDLAIHHVGNPTSDDKTILSEKLVFLENQAIETALMRHFFEVTKSMEMWRFDERFKGHELHQIVHEIWEEGLDVLSASQSLAQLLERCSNHPQIKSGELVVAKIQDVLVDDELIEVICLFKLETQKSYFRIEGNPQKRELLLLHGFDPRQIDKACMIFRMEGDDGYRICAQDRTSKAGDAKFWMGDYLRIERVTDDYYHTENVIEATKYFVHQHLKPTYDMDKTDEAHIMSRSKSYLQSKDSYDQASYASDVFETPELATQFQEYHADFNSDSGQDVQENFAIHPAAVKKSNRFFKSVIKLDKNFHVYVHGDRNMIRRGVDDTGRKYYMLFFDEES